ncbi:MAG: hypothetical protein Q9212_001376 [Teloschistes hypoglaucus]
MWHLLAACKATGVILSVLGLNLWAYTALLDDGPWKSLQGYASLSVQLVSSGSAMIMPGWISRSSPMPQSHHQEPSNLIWGATWPYGTRKNLDVCWSMSDDGQMSNTTCPINDPGPSQWSYSFPDKIPQIDEAKGTVNTRELLLAASFLAVVIVALVFWGCRQQRVKRQAQSDRLVKEIEVLHEHALAGIDLDHVTDAMDPLDSLLDLRQTVLRRIDSLMPSARMGMMSKLDQSILKAQNETLAIENETSAALCETLGFVSGAQEIRAWDLLAQVQGLEIENGNLTSEVNGLVDDLGTQGDYLEYIKKNLASQNEEFAVEKTDLEADKKGLADQTEELTAEIADLVADKKGLFDLVDDIKTQSEELGATNQSLQERNGGLVKENRDLKATREKLEEEVKASKSREVADAKAKTRHEGDIKRLEEQVS